MKCGKDLLIKGINLYNRETINNVLYKIKNKRRRLL